MEKTNTTSRKEHPQCNTLFPVSGAAFLSLAATPPPSVRAAISVCGWTATAYYAPITLLPMSYPLGKGPPDCWRQSVAEQTSCGLPTNQALRPAMDLLFWKWQPQPAPLWRRIPSVPGPVNPCRTCSQNPPNSLCFMTGRWKCPDRPEITGRRHKS